MLRYPHHRRAVLNLRDEFIGDPSVLALVLGGSVCHGYAREDSDIDCVIVVDEAEYAARREENRLQFYSSELAGYDGGYIDGKYQSPKFIEKVAERGSEPARFANTQGRLVKPLSDGAFAVYVFHAPIIIAITQLFRPVPWLPGFKFFAMVAVCLPVCFGAAYLLKKVPLLKKVL
jgi:predicted nucleotidyltransferase